MQVKHGSATIPASTTSWTSAAIGFAAEGLFLIARSTGSNHAEYSFGIVATSAPAGQISRGWWEQDGASEQDSGTLQGRRAVTVPSENSAANAVTAVATINANDFTLTFSPASPFEIQLEWWAVDGDTPFGVSQNDSNYGSPTINFPFVTQGAAFVPAVVGSMFLGANVEHNLSMVAALHLGNPTQGYQGCRYMSGHAYGAMNTFIATMDTEATGGAATWRNVNRAVESTVGVYESEDTGAAGTVDLTRVKNNFGDAWIDFFTIGERNNGKVAFGLAQMSGSASETINIPLGFDPKFFHALMPCAWASYRTQDDFMSSNTFGGGVCTGTWSSDDNAQRSRGYYQSGSSESSLDKLDDDTTFLNWGLSTPLTGSASLAVGADGESIDLNVSNPDGVDHYIIWLALGESGAPPAGPQLSGASTAPGATGSGTATITAPPAVDLSGAASAAAAQGSGTAISDYNALSGDANAAAAQGSGTAISDYNGLSGVASAAAAQGSGTALITIPAVLLSGAAAAPGATGDGTASITNPPDEELSGAAEAPAATGDGVIVSGHFASGDANAPAAQGSGTATFTAVSLFLSGDATAARARGSGIATIPFEYADEGECLTVRPQVSDLTVQSQVSSLTVINQKPLRRR